MNNYILDKNLGHSEKEVFTILKQKIDNNKETTISNKEISLLLNKSIVTISNAISSLEKNGYLKTKRGFQKRRIKIIKEE